MRQRYAGGAQIELNVLEEPGMPGTGWCDQCRRALVEQEFEKGGKQRLCPSCGLALKRGGDGVWLLVDAGRHKRDGGVLSPADVRESNATRMCSGCGRMFTDYYGRE